MQPSERLAAFLADELSTDERRALEADLARDGQLRTQLEAMRRADAALADHPSTALPPGARDRLLDALAPTFDEQLGRPADATDGADAAPGDELAQRRARRRTWIGAVGGVAAALAAVVVIGPSFTGSGNDDTDVAMDAGSDELTAESDSADDAAGDTELATAPGPVLTDDGRELDAERADQLLASPELDGIVAQELEPDGAARLATEWATAFGAVGDRSTDDDLAPRDGTTGDAPTDEDAAPDEEAEQALPETTEAAGVELRVDPGIDEAARADVARCLDVLLATSDVAVPVTAELVAFDGEPSIAFGLVGLDADGEVARREVWVLTQDACEVRYFSQG